MRLRNFIDLI